MMSVAFLLSKKKKAIMRELYSLRIEHSDDEMQLFLEGSDFLPFMPATLMQLLLDIGTGTLDACCIPSIFCRRTFLFRACSCTCTVSS